jgi:hypothetical protein
MVDGVVEYQRLVAGAEILAVCRESGPNGLLAGTARHEYAMNSFRQKNRGQKMVGNQLLISGMIFLSIPPIFLSARVLTGIFLSQRARLSPFAT